MLIFVSAVYTHRGRRLTVKPPSADRSEHLKTTRLVPVIDRRVTILSQVTGRNVYETSTNWLWLFIKMLWLRQSSHDGEEKIISGPRADGQCRRGERGGQAERLIRTTCGYFWQWKTNGRSLKKSLVSAESVSRFGENWFLDFQNRRKRVSATVSVSGNERIKSFFHLRVWSTPFRLSDFLSIWLTA